MNARFFRVGGCLRDEFLGIPCKDIDFAVEAESFDAMRNAVLAKGGEIFLETPKFFTIRAKVPSLGCADFVLCRKDGFSTDGRRPDSVTVGTIFDDLARRDFTMNAMAQDAETGEILDPHNGRLDITRREIRCVGDPDTRMREDLLRAFRALRFAVTKEMDPSNGVIRAIDDLRNDDRWEAVSTERIREELRKMFAFDTIRSLKFFGDFRFSFLLELANERGIWLDPTTRKA